MIFPIFNFRIDVASHPLFSNNKDVIICPNNPSAIIKEAPILPIAKTLKITVNTPIHPPQYIYKGICFLKQTFLSLIFIIIKKVTKPTK